MVAKLAVVDPPRKQRKSMTGTVLRLKQMMSSVARPQSFTLPEFPPGIAPKNARMAMDDAFGAVNAWGNQSAFVAAAAVNYASAALEGLAFPGYAFLAELAQRPEYRRISEIIATEMTRKWIKITSTSKDDDSKIEQIKIIESELKRLNVRDCFQKCTELDGYFGRAHLYIDTGFVDDREELKTPIGDGSNEVSMRKLVGKTINYIQHVEPVWTYPTSYNSIDPLKQDWYEPNTWFVLGKEIHKTRLLKFVGREVPDMLKPAYSFGGLSMSQMAIPYVNNWLRTRQSVADIIHSFSVFVLKTDLSESLSEGGEELFQRAEAFNMFRDNKGVFLLDKDGEDFANVSAPLGSLDHLQAQCLPGDTLIKTARGKIPICEVTDADRVMTRNGWAPVAWAGISGYVDELIEIETARSTIQATSWHPIYLPEIGGFVNAGNVKNGDVLLSSKDRTPRTGISRFSGVDHGGHLYQGAITAIVTPVVSCIAQFGKCIGGLFRKATTYITSTKIPAIIKSATSNLKNTETIALTTYLTKAFGMRSVLYAELNLELGLYGKHSTVVAGVVPRHPGSGTAICRKEPLASKLVWDAVRNLWFRPTRRDESIVMNAEVLSVRTIKTSGLVYDIKVADGFLPEFFANDILVHNSQEHMSSVSGIPLVKLTGISPSGLNATSEFEMRSFYDWINAFQEKLFRPNLTIVINMIQLSKIGKIDSDITFNFEPLWSLDEKGQAEVNQIKSQSGIAMVEAGILSQEEERKRVATDPSSDYSSIDVEDVPDLRQEEEQGLEPHGGAAKIAQGAAEQQGEVDPVGQVGQGEGSEDEEGQDDEPFAAGELRPDYIAEEAYERDAQPDHPGRGSPRNRKIAEAALKLRDKPGYKGELHDDYLEGKNPLPGTLLKERAALRKEATDDEPMPQVRERKMNPKFLEGKHQTDPDYLKRRSQQRDETAFDARPELGSDEWNDVVNDWSVSGAISHPMTKATMAALLASASWHLANVSEPSIEQAIEHIVDNVANAAQISKSTARSLLSDVISRAKRRFAHDKEGMQAHDTAANFKEDERPRDQDGKFAEGAGGSGTTPEGNKG